MRTSWFVFSFLVAAVSLPAPRPDDRCPRAEEVVGRSDHPVAVLVRPPWAEDAARRTAQQFSLDLNIPAHRLDVYEDGVRSVRYTVAVGMPGFRTPRGEYQVTSVEWNPWWIPPDREWSRDERPTPPGTTNPMGRVKINFEPLYFLHGTPSVQSLGHSASHGCVRMSNQDVIALALRVHAAGAPSVGRATLDSLIADTSRTRRFYLEYSVPLRIRYDVAEVIDDTLFLYRDTYALDRRSDLQRTVGALTTAGMDSARIPHDRLRKILRSNPRRPLAIALSILLSPDP